MLGNYNSRCCHPEIDDYIAGLQLVAMDLGIDTLTAAQKKYLSSWQEGT